MAGKDGGQELTQAEDWMWPWAQMSPPWVGEKFPGTLARSEARLCLPGRRKGWEESGVFAKKLKEKPLEL